MHVHEPAVSLTLSSVQSTSGSPLRSNTSVRLIFREPPKINGIALVIKAGFRALLVVRRDGDVGVQAPGSPPVVLVSPITAPCTLHAR